MIFDFKFFFFATGLGIGLAMDAFSVSLANGLNEPCMKVRKACGIAGMFAFFQALMPLIGWICVHSILQWFGFFEALIPWIALALLGYIGGKMLYDSIQCKDEGNCVQHVGFRGLVVQGIATSIDALSVGFTISHYAIWEALITVLVIALITFILCLLGVLIGKTAGTRLAGKAGVLGGIILIAIGLEIFITSWF